MTDKSPQIRVRIDHMLHTALVEMRAAAHRTSGRRKPTIQTLLEAKLVKLSREEGFESVIRPDTPFPMVFAPPSSSDAESISFALRIHDPAVHASIVKISDEASRPTAHILYSLLRHVVTSTDMLQADTQASA